MSRPHSKLSLGALSNPKSAGFLGSFRRESSTSQLKLCVSFASSGSLHSEERGEKSFGLYIRRASWPTWHTGSGVSLLGGSGDLVSR